MDPTLHCKMMGHLFNRAGAGCASQKNRQLLEIAVNIETGAKLSETI